MTQVWQGDKVIAVTRVQAGPCPIVQIKNESKDGYAAAQVGYGEKKEKNIKKPQKEHLNKLKIKNKKLKINLKYLREFRISSEEASKLGAGDVIDVTAFAPGDKIEVEGVSKGKGFQGVVKRHGFHGQDKTHGNKDQLRMPGSIGAQAPQRVFKGVRMAGRMGGGKVTTKNLEIIDIDKENNMLLIGGAVPGARDGLVMIAGQGELKVISPKKEEDRQDSLNSESIKKGAEGKSEMKSEKLDVEKIEKADEKISEEKKEEKPLVAEKKAVEIVKDEEKGAANGAQKEPEEKVFKEDYLNKFNALPEELRDKLAKSAMREIINNLEGKYGVDLVAAIMKVEVKELNVNDLREYFKSEFNLEDKKAEELTGELKEKVLSAF